jgi:hypothetical protein
MNWQVVKYRHPMLFMRLPEGDIYQLKLNEDGTIEQIRAMVSPTRCCKGLSAKLRCRASAVSFATSTIIRPKRP